MRGNEPSDHRIIQEFWNVQKIAPNVIDPFQMFREITIDIYNQDIVNPNSGKFLADRPYFVIFIEPQNQYCQMMKDNLEKLAEYYNGTIQFGWINVNSLGGELLKYTFDAYKPPRSNFLNVDGNSYGFDPIVTGYATTKRWIDEKRYLKSP